MSRAKRVMIQGTMSGVGKSLLCAALCRIFRQDGFRAAPFKSQNMALNSYVTADGREMGRAQVMQAEAAGLEPDARMNPILLKPSSDTGSQVIVYGRVRGQMTAAEYFRRRKDLIPEIMAAYDSLASENDIMVIEGAGSPAEINLRENDIVNMGLAALVDAPVLLAGDIDRGGVFAHLFGTLALLDAGERRRVKGLLINKFRGDLSLLGPGLTQMEALAGIPVLGVVPYLSVELDEEDSLAPALSRRQAHKAVDIAVIRLPHVSNFTDFAPLERHPALGVRYVHRAGDLGTPDLILLPGTKSTMADLLWMRENGIESGVLARARAGTWVLGICGGYQMLGQTLRDPMGTEESVPILGGMGLLPCETVFGPAKTLSRVRAVIEGGALDGAAVEGYEIHTGVTAVEGLPFCRLENGQAEGCRSGTVAGTYLHGLFDGGEAVRALARALCEKKGIPLADEAAENARAFRERQYHILAEEVRRAVNLEAIYQIMGLG